MFVCCKCCVLSGRGLCDEMITRPEESYRLWCVVVCDQDTSRMRRPWPALGRSATEKKLFSWKYLITIIREFLRNTYFPTVEVQNRGFPIVINIAVSKTTTLFSRNTGCC